MTDDLPEIPNTEIIFYQTEDGQSRIQVRLENETLWLTQAALAELYQTSVPNINTHLSNVYEDGELDEEATIKDSLIVRREGSRQVERRIKHYNLDAILAVGYRVRSQRGVQFRRWATQQLREYLVKGFVMDDERLKEGRNIGADYFDELLERIRDIRASEKRFYRKIRDIYRLAVDYDKDAPETREFFQIVQNKLHFAITGRTAAELIAERADADKPNMGLTSWKGAVVRKTDVTVAKNYLNQAEMSQLNRVIVMYLDYAEDQAQRRRPLYMRDWRERLDAFLQFNQRDILNNAGKVEKTVADRLALDQYARFHQRRLRQEARQEALEDDALDDLARRLEPPKGQE